jgi:hypothetical protein
MNQDSRPGDLASLYPHKRTVFRFDLTVSSGTLIQIAVLRELPRPDHLDIRPRSKCYAHMGDWQRHNRLYSQHSGGDVCFV